MGRITRLDRLHQKLVVRIDEQSVTYDYSDLDELVDAYAITVHKSQGSEYGAVVVPVLTQQHVMLQSNLLYTAVTRARQLVVLIGSRQAVALAVRSNRIVARNSALSTRLREM